MDELRLRFLGGLRVEGMHQPDGSRLPNKTLALLCYLAVTGEPQTRTMLASLLWSDFPEQRARSNLRDTLAVLRRSSLAPFVTIEHRAIAFNRLLPHWIDTAALQLGVAESMGGVLVNVKGLETAVSLYQGDFLAGFHLRRASLFEEWMREQRQEMHLLVVSALARLVDFHLDAGSYEAGIPHAHHLLTLDPWREQSHRRLMLLLLREGAYSAALKQYDACCQILADELGVSPERKTQILYQNILKQAGNQQPAKKPHLVADASFYPALVPHNLVGQMTPFIGREREQRAIDNVLGDQTARLVTIFGVGGSGKTRLALAVAEKQTQAINRDGGFRFPDGVFFVPLEAVESPVGIVPAICQAVGFRPADEERAGRSVERQLRDYLCRKQLLLVLDNFEQLMAGIGILIKICRSAPDVYLLVTSRQRLSLQGERLFALDGLQYPQASEQVMEPKRLLTDYSAATLFAVSARRIAPDYQLDDEDVSALIRLCRLVDGLPLAVELAAAWVNVLSLPDIVAQLEQGLSFLESHLHDLPDRHRSMEAVFDVSWRQLTPVEQTVFAQLSIFLGGFTRPAAAQVAGASLPQLAMLVNKALIRYDKELDRYYVHRLLRQFGRAKLAEDVERETAVRQRHSAFYTNALQQWYEQLKGSDQLTALAEFDQESANGRLAWHFAVETGQFAQVAQAADGLGQLYLWRRHFHEGETAFALAQAALLQAVAANKTCTSLQKLLARIQIWQSIFCKQAEAEALVQQALARLDAPWLGADDTRQERAFGLERAGNLAFDAEGDAAQDFFRRSLTLYRQLDDAWGMERALTDLGWWEAHYGAVITAQQFGEDALALGRASGDQKQLADTLWLLGTLAILQGQIEGADRLLGESLDIRKVLGDRLTDIAAGPLDLGMTLTWIGRMGEADAVREETLALYQAQGQSEQIALAHVRLATSKVHVGQFEAAERLAQLGVQQCREMGNQRGVGLALWILGTLSLTMAQIDRAESLLQEGLSIFQEIEGAAEVGWVLVMLSDSARQRGQLTLARAFLHKALGMASGVLGFVTVLLGLAIYLNILADEGQEERAVAVGAILEKYPFTRVSPGCRLLYAKRLAEVKGALAPAVVAEAEARGQAWRDLQKIAAKVLAELEEVVEG